MLSSSLFRKSTAWIGVITHGLDLAHILVLPFLPVLGAVLLSVGRIHLVGPALTSGNPVVYVQGSVVCRSATVSAFEAVPLQDPKPQGFRDFAHGCSCCESIGLPSRWESVSRINSRCSVRRFPAAAKSGCSGEIPGRSSPGVTLAFCLHLEVAQVGIGLQILQENA